MNFTQDGIVRNPSRLGRLSCCLPHPRTAPLTAPPRVPSIDVDVGHQVGVWLSHDRQVPPSLASAQVVSFCKHNGDNHTAAGNQTKKKVSPSLRCVWHDLMWYLHGSVHQLCFIFFVLPTLGDGAWLLTFQHETSRSPAPSYTEFPLHIHILAFVSHLLRPMPMCVQ